MAKSIISEGKTTNEAIEKGLKELKVSKKMVDIKVLENEEKRSFFSILAPRVVKVELTVKEDTEIKNKEKPGELRLKREINLNAQELEKAEKNVKEFLEELKQNLPEETTYNIKKTEKGLEVELNSKDLGFLIGYRGETLYAMQSILSSIASRGNQDREIGRAHV